MFVGTEALGQTQNTPLVIDCNNGRSNMHQSKSSHYGNPFFG